MYIGRRLGKKFTTYNNVDGNRLNPDTDGIAIFSPFLLIPTPYWITVDGEQKSFDQ